ncbi:MAG: hypothetical protein HeimC3_07750 [Candidatus Heimdallarchaeota archaeon LC_3]|nr:MAG: hypothetical protein HeimC3_07750 [Candidatus Heimdallarchaeota archaeon LC_3]
MRLLSKKISINLKFFIMIGIFFFFIVPNTNLIVPVLEKERNIEKDSREINSSIKNSLSAVQPLILTTPESKTYNAPMSGYFPGTFAFENNIHGTTGTNIDFIDEYYDTAGGDFVDIYVAWTDWDGHKKHLQVRDAQSGTYTWGVHHFNSAPISGTVEFLQSTTGTTGVQYFQLRANDDTTAIEIRYNLVVGKYQYFDGSTWVDIADISRDFFVHHSISFDCNTGVNGQFTWIISYVNGTEIGRVDNIEFVNDLNSIEELYVGTDTLSYLIGTQYDAFGFSWDPDYNIGDNRHEGLLISFDTSTPYDWIGYSLDGNNNVTIYGNTTIPMPAAGSHVIQVIANDSLGDWYVSDLRAFQTNYLEDHLPIIIDGNADFATQAGIEGWQGNGSQSNPYIIEDYFINNASNHGIIISNANVFFIIRDVWVNGSDQFGFYLDNTNNGALYFNNATNNKYQFQLLYSDYNTLVGNNADGHEGFRVQWSHNNILTNNTATGSDITGIYLERANQNILTNNTATNNNFFGFYLAQAHQNTFINNTATNNAIYGFHLYSSDQNTFTGNNVINNINHGFYLRGSSDLNSLSFNLVSDNNAGVYIDDCSENTISRNIFEDNSYGVQLTANSAFNIVIDNIFISNINGDIRNDGSNNIVSHDSISIDGNSDFASQALSEGWPGDGSENNPYLIKDYLINGSILEGVEISNTNVYFVLESILVNNSGTHGIQLVNVTNAKLINNTAINSVDSGFDLVLEFNNNVVINNTAINNGRAGFGVWWGDNNLLMNNTAINNGQHGFQLENSNYNGLFYNVATNNSQHGFSFYLNANYNNFTFNYGVNNGESGVKSTQSSNNYIHKNILENNLEYGIWLDASSSFYSVIENTVLFNYLGDIKDDGSSNTILNNNVSDSPLISTPSDFSIYFGDTGYSILWTVTDNNPANYTVYDNGTIFDTGFWTDSVITWLDGLEEGLHNFTCIVQNSYGKSASDQVVITVLPAAPDTTLPTISSPADFSFEEGSIGYNVAWIGSEDHPWWASVWRNNTLIYDQSWTLLNDKIEINLDGLNAGLYNFTCSLFDEAGNSVSDMVLITVTVAALDTEAPIITPPNPVTYEEGSTGNTITWNCSDAHPYAYQIMINNTSFPNHVNNPWHGENITISIDDLNIGIWVLNLTLWDLSGNIASNEVIIEVIPEAPDITAPFASQPADLIVTENMSGTIIWEVNDEHPYDYVIRKNGTQIFVRDYWVSGIIQYHFSSLPLGTWEFNLTVWDEAGNSFSSIAIVKVLLGNLYDIQTPEISHIPDQTFIFGSKGNSIVIYLFDQNPQGYSSFILGVTQNPIETPWSIPNIQFELSLDGLAVGIYTINISAWDVFDNFNSLTFTVTVTGDTTPPTVNHLSDITTYSSIPVSFTWVVSDNVLLSYFEIIDLNSEQLIVNDTIVGNVATFEIDNLYIGIYDFRIIVYDSSGNFAMDDVRVTVIEGEPSPIEISTSPGFDFFSIFTILLFVIISKKAINNKRRSKK